MDERKIPENDFGKYRKVTRVGLGGEGVLRTRDRAGDAEEVIGEAIAQKITYFDSARVYADSELYYGEIWGRKPEERAKIFQASKSASRDREGALKDLRETLERLNTDYLDLWQIHDVRTSEDIRAISGRGGALEAFVEARDSGRVRAIGVTGHHDPEILARAVRQWPVDSVMMPVNPVEGVLAKTRPEAFLLSPMSAAVDKGIAVIAMKVLGASHYIFPNGGVTAETLIRYALSYPITVAIVGCSTPEHFRALAETGANAESMDGKERVALEEAFEPHVSRLAYYRGVL